MANAKYGDPIICFLGLEFPPSMQDEVQCCLSNYFPKSYAWRNEGKTGGLEATGRRPGSTSYEDISDMELTGQQEGDEAGLLR
jgi:hypothetical protein